MNSELATSHSLPATSSTADQEVLVKVEGVSNKFCRSLKRSLWYGICDIAGELNLFAKQGAGPPARRPYGSERSMEHGANGTAEVVVDAPAAAARDEDLREGEFYAVREVSFELRRGECLGLIGHNGAGKTTLLKMLNGLIKPDTGRIEMNGRVGALIALGAGFNPILTGRENIYINGSVLGLSKKEIDEKIKEIIDFAEIGKFIDMPVQNYSSGMQVRLGFAVATALEPDILILDEVLAVGDIGFVIKCLNRVRKLTSNAAVILVSHNMQSVSSFCTRAILMERGKTAVDKKECSEAIDRYFEMIPHELNETGTKEATLDSISLVDAQRVCHGDSVTVDVAFSISASVKGALVTVYIADESMMPLVCMPLHDENAKLLRFKPGYHKMRVDLGSIEVVSGKYSLIVLVEDEATKRILLRSQGLNEFRVFAKRAHWGKIMRPVTAKPFTL